MITITTNNGQSKMQNRYVNKSWPLSSIILTLAGLGLLGTGHYVILLRSH